MKHLTKLIKFRQAVYADASQGPRMLISSGRFPGGGQMFSLDDTAWLHPAAKTLADRQYTRGSTQAVHRSILVGHPYSLLAWVPDPTRSWSPPVSVRRITSHHTQAEVGVMQVKQLCHLRGEETRR
jgi:hypothetical protein